MKMTSSKWKKEPCFRARETISGSEIIIVMMMSCIALVKRSFIHRFYSVMERLQFRNSLRSRFPEGSCCFYFALSLSALTVLYRALKMSGTKSSWNNSQFSTHERCHIFGAPLSLSLFILDTSYFESVLTFNPNNSRNVDSLRGNNSREMLFTVSDLKNSRV